MTDRRKYKIKVYINNRWFLEVIIDTHYEQKHAESINDFMIIKLIKTLHGRKIPIEAKDEAGFEYYKSDPVYLLDKPYRLIWLTHPAHDFIGVITAFRRRYGKKFSK